MNNRNRTFSPGFRLSLIDSVILAAGIGSAIFSSQEIALIVGTAIGHFFLFCNVSRTSRKPELTWAALFTLLSGATLLFHLPGWLVTISVSFVFAAVLIGLEMRKPSYHGILWRTLNPNLLEWWQSQQNT